jgi:rhodanese-related sulfurtransferase
MAKTAAELVQEARTHIKNVSPRDALREIASGEAVVLDVREPAEWEQHIQGSVQVPRGLLEFAADPASPQHKPGLDPSRRVIVYCRSGVRGTLAAFTLKAMGYENVANLDGRFTAWKEAGFPIDEHHPTSSKVVD